MAKKLDIVRCPRCNAQMFPKKKEMGCPLCFITLPKGFKVKKFNFWKKFKKDDEKE